MPVFWNALPKHNNFTYSFQEDKKSFTVSYSFSFFLFQIKQSFPNRARDYTMIYENQFIKDIWKGTSFPSPFCPESPPAIFPALSAVNVLLRYSSPRFTCNSRFLNRAVLYVDYTNGRLRIYGSVCYEHILKKWFLIRLFAADENSNAAASH